jgi:3-methyl-2-oxobutanoate hydroxymethyltransferase
MSIGENSVVPTRETDGGRLKRVTVATGAYVLRNYTVKDIQDLKGKRQLTQTLPFLPEEAAAAAEAGIDVMKVRFDPADPSLAKEIRAAAPHTFMSFSCPLVVPTSPEEALRLAFDAVEAGADSIMCQWSPRFIAALAEAGVPAEGHAGLVPRKSHWIGGLKAPGKKVDEAKKIFDDIKALEEAGAWAVEVEVIPPAILAEITKRTTLVTSSIGAGPGDIQFLFAQDILGDGKAPFPRHAKVYRDLHAMRQMMQEERIAAFKEYVADVQSGAFPGPEHIVPVADDVVADFIKALDKD